ncbi:hypothetical protein LINPERHAP2_LOCUS42565 [Linum perenne]
MYPPDTSFDIAAAIKDSTAAQRNPAPQQRQQKNNPADQETTTSSFVLGSRHWTMYSCLDSRPAAFQIVGVEGLLLKKEKKFPAEFVRRGGSGGPPLKVQMVDDTVLIEPDSTVFRKASDANWKRTWTQKNHSRGGGACYVAKKKKMKKKDSSSVKRYSRVEMEGMRLVNSEEQREIWRSVYGGLGAEAVEEYETMVWCDTQKNGHPRFEYRPNVLGSAAVGTGLLGSGRWNHLNATKNGALSIK